MVWKLWQPSLRSLTMKLRQISWEIETATNPIKAQRVQQSHPGTSEQDCGPVVLGRNPTTSSLTATTFLYAIGAGITAAAGTRLALQSKLVKGFQFYSFQLQDMGALYFGFVGFSNSSGEVPNVAFTRRGRQALDSKPTLKNNHTLQTIYVESSISFAV